MDKDTLPESLGLIKHPPETEEELTSLLFQSKTLLELLLKEDLATYPKSDVHNCLLILCGLNQGAIKPSETLQRAVPTPQLKTAEELTQALFNAESVIELLLNQDLTTYSLSGLHNCLLTLLGLTQQAIKLSETFQGPIPLTVLASPEETPDA